MLSCRQPFISTPSRPISSQVTAATSDLNGTLWTGHDSGAVRASLMNSAASAALVCNPSLELSLGPAAAITAMAADEGERRCVVWAGDAAGRLMAVTYDASLHSVTLVWPLMPLASPRSHAAGAVAADLPTLRKSAANISEVTPQAEVAAAHGSLHQKEAGQPPPRSSPPNQASAAVGSSSSVPSGSPVTCMLSKQGLLAAATASGLLYLVRSADATQLVSGAPSSNCSVPASHLHTPPPPTGCHQRGRQVQRLLLHCPRQLAPRQPQVRRNASP